MPGEGWWPWEPPAGFTCPALALLPRLLPGHRNSATGVDRGQSVWACAAGCWVLLCLHKPALPPVPGVNSGCTLQRRCMLWMCCLLELMCDKQSKEHRRQWRIGNSHFSLGLEARTVCCHEGCRGVRDVWDQASWGVWCWAGCWDYLLSGFLAKHKAGTTHSTCPCSGISGRSGRRQVPGCPQGYPSGSVHSGAIQRALGSIPAPHQEETSLVSSFSVHFTHHFVSRRHLSAQALENAAQGSPATVLVLFLLSLLRQGFIKRVFALLKPRITPHLLKVFSAGLRRSSPPPRSWSCFKACRSLQCRSLPCVPHTQSRCLLCWVCAGAAAAPPVPAHPDSVPCVSR